MAAWTHDKIHSFTQTHKHSIAETQWKKNTRVHEHINLKNKIIEHIVIRTLEQSDTYEHMKADHLNIWTTETP